MTLIPKIIYLFWHSRNLPYFVRKCIENIKSKNPGYLVKIYYYEDVMKIQDKPEILKTYRKRGIADWLRLYLLNKYGGIWIDISCIFVSKGLNDIIDLNKNVLYGYNAPWGDIMENWFLASPKNNPIVKEWLKEWEIALLNKEEYVKKNIQYSTKALTPMLPYLTQHLIFSKISKIEKLSKCYSILGKASDKGNPFYLHEKFNWNIDKFINFLLNSNHIDNDISFIKLRGGDRNKFIEALDKCNFSKNSYLVKLLNLRCKNNNKSNYNINYNLKKKKSKSNYLPNYSL